MIEIALNITRTVEYKRTVQYDPIIQKITYIHRKNLKKCATLSRLHQGSGTSRNFFICYYTALYLYKNVLFIINKRQNFKITYPPSLIKMILCEHRVTSPYTPPLSSLPPIHIHTDTHAETYTDTPHRDTHGHTQTDTADGLYTTSIWYIYTVYILGC